MKAFDAPPSSGIQTIFQRQGVHAAALFQSGQPPGPGGCRDKCDRQGNWAALSLGMNRPLRVCSSRVGLIRDCSEGGDAGPLARRDQRSDIPRRRDANESICIKLLCSGREFCSLLSSPFTCRSSFLYKRKGISAFLCGIILELVCVPRPRGERRGIDLLRSKSRTTRWLNARRESRAPTIESVHRNSSEKPPSNEGLAAEWNIQWTRLAGATTTQHPNAHEYRTPRQIMSRQQTRSTPLHSPRLEAARRTESFH